MVIKKMYKYVKTKTIKKKEKILVKLIAKLIKGEKIKKRTRCKILFEKKRKQIMIK